jgi:twitching motility protein PilT
MNRVDEYLQIATDMGASDLHLKGGRPPLLRLDGELLATDLPPLEASEVAAMIEEVISRRYWELFNERWELDMAYVADDWSR